MATPVFVASSNKIYRIGRVGIDTGTQDAGGVYTGVLRTEKHSPLGEDGLALFRRVWIRVFHTGSWTATVKVFVDNVQTQEWDSGTSAMVDQVSTLTASAPSNPPVEVVKEVAISAQGTSIEVEVSVASNNITGVFLIESMDTGFVAVREGKERGAVS